MPINKKLFRRVRNRILRVPEAYNQLTFGAPSDLAPCGTMACIAGHALIEDGFCTPAELARRKRDHEDMDVVREARKRLGLTRAQGYKVFGHYVDWPAPFAEQFCTADRSGDHIAMSRAAADYINFIIRTGNVT